MSRQLHHVSTPGFMGYKKQKVMELYGFPGMKIKIILFFRSGKPYKRKVIEGFFTGDGISIASYADVLRLVTHSSPRTSVQRTSHFCSLAVSLCFKRPNPLFC